VRSSVTTFGLASLLLLSWLSAARGSADTQRASSVVVGVPGRANANVSIAASGASVAVAWAARTADGTTDVYTAVSHDGGRSFGMPVRVNRVPGEASISGEQPPRIVWHAGRSTDPAIVVLWTAKSPSGTRLVSARSTDGGTSFGPTEAVPGGDASGNRGWESAAVTATGEVVAAWLDHREVAARTTGGATGGAHQHGAATHQPATDGVARAQLSQIWFARLGDSASARAIAPGVCYCCKTSIATGQGGIVAAAWRHVYPGNVRDIALSASSDGGRTFAPPVRVSEDNWALDGCPENGPAIAIDATNAIHIVWPTLVRGPAGDETPALFYATSKDGRRFTTRQQIPTVGVPWHPQIAVVPGGPVTVAWEEQRQGARHIVVANVVGYDTGRVRFARRSVSDDPGTYPAIVSQDNAVLVAWTTGTTGNTSLRVARLPAVR
jgi:hypothetical protein